MKGSTLNFKKESAAFAKALQNEHSALGDLIDALATAGALDPGDGDFQIVLPRAELKIAREAHAAVRFQRTRTEASVGRR